MDHGCSVKVTLHLCFCCTAMLCSISVCYTGNGTQKYYLLTHQIIYINTTCRYIRDMAFALYINFLLWSLEMVIINYEFYFTFPSFCCSLCDRRLGTSLERGLTGINVVVPQQVHPPSPTIPPLLLP